MELKSELRIEEVGRTVELSCCLVEDLLVVLVDWLRTFVASMGLVLTSDHRSWSLWVSVGMQCVREELPPDPRV